MVPILPHCYSFKTMTTVTCAIIEKDGKILIARRASDQNLAGKWEFPGGKVEDGESPEECLKRELEEEFGIQVEVGGIHHIKRNN